MTNDDFKLIISKGIYPYEYINSFEKFNEPQLPSIDKFYSSLNDETINENDYEHALKVWKTFDIKNLGEYHDFYLMTDVLLLADVFENFRDFDLKTYNLDPAHYITGPSFCMDAALKKYNKRIELFNDEQSDMYLFVEKDIRGGNSFISHRHSKANNKYMKNYDNTKPSKYIMYFDANNLYGWAMMQKLAVGGFKWENSEEYTIERINNLSDVDSRHCILNVDLEYPKEIHDLHNDYPLCPEKKLVKDEYLSPFQINLKNKLKITKDTVEKLIVDLTDKDNYTLHFKNLQLYLQLGMKLKKVHKVLSYNAEAWLKDYIVKNSELRQQAKSIKDDFKANTLKINNNGVFGKQMENVRNRVDIELVKENKERYLKVLSHPTFKRRTIFDENLVAVHKNKKEIKLDKPILNGMIILDLSKYLMYDFYFNVMKKKYNDKIKLLFTDTDSLTVEVETEDIYEDMKGMKQYFDFSEYPKSHQLYSTENQAVPGKFKDETSSKIITEFVGLRSKLYSLIIEGEKKEKKVAKGVKKCVINKKLCFNDYKDVLNNKTQLKREMNFIKSKLHKVNTINIEKICLSAYDNKSYILDNGIDMLRFGHYLIK